MKNLITTMVALLILTACSRTPQDYVTAYDFTSAPLVDLPWEMGATIVGAGSFFDYDAYVREHHPNWNYVQHQQGDRLFMNKSYVPKDSTNYVYTVDDPSLIIPQYDSVDDSCRLVDGCLWYELDCIDGVVTTSSNSWFKLEVEVLEYGDFNQDGFMDVLVRRMLGGSACPREELILSRKTPDGQFYVVDIQSGAIRIRTGEGWSWEKNPDGTKSHQIHIFIDVGVTIADLVTEYGVTEEIIRSANGLGEEDEIQEGSWVVVPDKE